MHYEVDPRIKPRVSKKKAIILLILSGIIAAPFIAFWLGVVFYLIEHRGG